MFNPTLRTALLGSGAALALMAGPAFAGQTEDLKAQIDSLQSRLDQIEKQSASADVKQVAAPTDAVVGGDFPGSFKLPGSDTSVAIHGYTKLDAFWDAEGTPGFSFSIGAIPRNHSVAARQDGQFQLHARQSRFNIQTRTPTNYGEMRTYIEGDFFGSTAGQTGTNGHGFRLRQAYGSLGPVLAGQTWSNFIDLDDSVETLDFAGPVGVLTGRKPQIRYTQAFGKLSLSASIENPSVNVMTPTGGTANNVNRMPDLTARASYSDSWGHLHASGVLRRLSVDNGLGGAAGTASAGTQLKDDIIAGGGLLGASLNLSALGVGGMFAKDQIGAQGYLGDGLDVYSFASTGGGNGAVAVTNAAGTSVTIKGQLMYGGFAYATHHWTDQLRSNIAYGRGKVDYNSSVTATNKLEETETVHVNLIWSPVKSVNIGLEFMYGNAHYFTKSGTAGSTSGNTGNDERLQASFQYVF